MYDRQDLTKFIGKMPGQRMKNLVLYRANALVAEGTSTQDIMDNPNKILSDAIKGQNITKIIVFQVTAGSADTVKPSTVGTTVPGGGTANIDFLTGDDKKDGPNSAVP